MKCKERPYDVAGLASLTSLLGDELMAEHLGGVLAHFVDAVGHLDTALEAYHHTT